MKCQPQPNYFKKFPFKNKLEIRDGWVTQGGLMALRNIGEDDSYLCIHNL